MLNDILFNATIPGACMNAISAAEESERQSKLNSPKRPRSMKRHEKRALLCSKFWPRLASRIGRWKQSAGRHEPAKLTNTH